MNPFRRIADFFRRKPGMIGTPPTARPRAEPIPADSADHAEDFSHRWADKLDEFAAICMEDLGIPKDQIGASDNTHGIRWCAFNPHERTGGGVTPDGRITLDSGILNPELLDKDYGQEAGRLWRESGLQDRADALIAHEREEHRHGMSHEAALKAAPTTDLPISHRAREIARAMERGWKGGRPQR